MGATGGSDPYFTKKPSQGPSGRLIIAEKPGFEKKISKIFWDFFSMLTGGTLWKSMKKILNFFFEPRFFGHNKPSWGPLGRFYGEIWLGTTGCPHDFGPKPIWPKWSLTNRSTLKKNSEMEFFSIYSLENVKVEFAVSFGMVHFLICCTVGYF